MKIEELQNEIDRINEMVCEHYNFEPTDKQNVTRQVLKLGEEYGELCEAVLSSMGIQRQEKLDAHSMEDIKGELADVIITAMTAARYMNIDIEDIVVSKLKIIKERFTNKNK